MPRYFLFIFRVFYFIFFILSSVSEIVPSISVWKVSPAYHGGSCLASSFFLNSFMSLSVSCSDSISTFMP